MDSIARRLPWMAPLPGSEPERLAQIGAEVNARLDADPRAHRIASPVIDMFAVPNFVTPAECEELVGMIEADVVPSTSLSNRSDAEVRTSSTCKLSADNPLVATIEKRICDLLGLSIGNSETVQGQRYLPGQQFRLHNDYFGSGQSYSDAAASEGGQRTWTAMAYLNRVESGGHTAFPQVPVSIPPTPGVLLVWNNIDRDGESNPYSHHMGSKVEAGSKYVLTKWFREREWTPTGASDSHRA